MGHFTKLQSTLLIALPLQPKPPTTPPLHWRSSVLVPFPHVSEHGTVIFHCVQVPGQGSEEQDSCSELDPSHPGPPAFPPMQERVLVFVPLPQVTGHLL